MCRAADFSDGHSASIQPDSVCVYGYQIPLNVNKTVKSITLPNTRNIVMLSMDLTTPNIPGTFVYTPPAGTVEPVGTDTLSVTFTPTDTTDYKPASATVQLLVENPPAPIVTPDDFLADPGAHHLRHAVGPDTTRCGRYGHGKSHARDPRPPAGGDLDLYRRHTL